MPYCRIYLKTEQKYLLHAVFVIKKSTNKLDYPLSFLMPQNNTILCNKQKDYIAFLIERTATNNCFVECIGCYYKILFYYHENMIDKQEINKFIEATLQYKAEIAKLKSLFDTMRNIFDVANKEYSISTSHKQKSIDKYLLKSKICVESKNPFDLDNKIRFTNVAKVHNSASFPIEFVFCEINKLEKPKAIRILYKRGDDLTKDILVLQIAQQMAKILDLDIFLYKIIPLSRTDGIVEMIDATNDVFTSETALSSFISAKKEVKDNFVKSFVFWSMLSYLLGVGDRSAKNILVNETGCITYIDFSYILGKSSKYIDNGLQVPNTIRKVIKNSSDMTEKSIETLKENIACLRTNIENLEQDIENITADPMHEYADKEIISYIKSKLQLHMTKEQCLCFYENIWLSALYDRKNILASLINRIGTFLRQ